LPPPVAALHAPGERKYPGHRRIRLLHRHGVGYDSAMDGILIALAGVMGAAGIGLTAAGAHGKPGTGLDSAGYLLLIHAVAILAGILAVRSSLVLRPLSLIVLWGFVLGAGLFAADVASRAFLGGRLFPMAAPAGGTILILSWLVLIAAALGAMRAG